MKKTLIWIFTVIITLSAAYYQRKTGPTYPKRISITLNDSLYNLKLVRSLGHDERPEVKLAISDTSVKALLFYKIYKSDEEYHETAFEFKTYPVDSEMMRNVFKITEESGFFAQVPQQPEAGKLQYYIQLTDREGTHILFQQEPVIIRFKGAVPSYVLVPHIILMFIAMLFSTAAGLLALFRIDSYKRTGAWTLVLLTLGGMILGPVVQKFAFGDLWTGIPFGWDLTDNKTLIAFIFWIIAVLMSYKKDKPGYTVLASVVLLLVYSIPHSLFGSELDYSTGQVVQGFILCFFFRKRKNS